jgi:hypothetical protein
MRRERINIPLKETFPRIWPHIWPKLMLKYFPRGIGEEEDNIGLKKPQRIIDIEDN